MKLLKRLFREDDGATMVEYGLLVSLIAVFLIGAIVVLRNNIDALFRGITF